MSCVDGQLSLKEKLLSRIVGVLIPDLGRLVREASQLEGLLDERGVTRALQAIIVHLND